MDELRPATAGPTALSEDRSGLAGRTIAIAASCSASSSAMAAASASHSAASAAASRRLRSSRLSWRSYLVWMSATLASMVVSSSFASAAAARLASNSICGRGGDVSGVG